MGSPARGHRGTRPLVALRARRGKRQPAAASPDCGVSATGGFAGLFRPLPGGILCWFIAAGQPLARHVLARPRNEPCPATSPPQLGAPLPLRR